MQNYPKRTKQYAILIYFQGIFSGLWYNDIGLIIHYKEQIPLKQLSFIEELETISPITLLKCLSDNIDIKELIPYSFHSHFYKTYGRNRKYSLSSFISALLLQKMLSIPTDELLIKFLNISQELRDFCGFGNGVPDKTQFSRFKTTFADDIEDAFHLLVDLTEPVCRSLGKHNAETLIIDTTGIESYVTENNSKYLKGVLTKLNTLLKSNKINIANIDKSILGHMSKQSNANPDVKLQYINGHFAYAHKGTLICNAHGILRHMQFGNYKEYSDSPQDSKHIHDSTLFLPALNSLFAHHPNFKAKYIVGDSGFDSTGNHNAAFKNFGLIPFISLNPRNTNVDIPNPSFNDGTPCCPRNNELPLKYCGVCKEDNRATRFKYICPKAKLASIGFILDCDTPCSSSKCGYIHYEYESDNLRANPPIARNSDKYLSIANKRYIIEQVISRLKLPLNMGSSYVRNTKTTKCDFFMAGIAHLVTVLLAYRMDLPHLVRSTKSITG